MPKSKKVNIERILTDSMKISLAGHQGVYRAPGTKEKFFVDLERLRKRVLKKMEIHQKAEAVIEENVNIYREHFYNLARIIAYREAERHIITKAHALKAREKLHEQFSKKTSLADILLIIASFILSQTLNISLIIDGKFILTVGHTFFIMSGAFLFAMGMFWKLR